MAAKRAAPPMLSSTGGFGSTSILDEASHPFVWENDESVWVSGPIGDKVLRRLKQHFGEEEVLAPVRPPLFDDGRRGKCEAKIVDERGRRRFNGCQRYDPVIVLPDTLFTRTEISTKFMPAARRLAEELYAEGKWPSTLSRREDYEEQIQAFTPQPFLDAGRKCSVFCYRLRPAMQARILEQVGPTTPDLRLAFDRDEMIVNGDLLPKLLRWCEEFMTTKLTMRAQGKVEDVKPNRPRLVCRCGHAEVWHQTSHRFLGERLQACSCGFAFQNDARFCSHCNAERPQVINAREAADFEARQLGSPPVSPIARRRPSQTRLALKKQASTGVILAGGRLRMKEAGAAVFRQTF